MFYFIMWVSDENKQLNYVFHWSIHEVSMKQELLHTSNKLADYMIHLTIGNRINVVDYGYVFWLSCWIVYIVEDKSYN